MSDIKCEKCDERAQIRKEEREKIKDAIRNYAKVKIEEAKESYAVYKKIETVQMAWEVHKLCSLLIEDMDFYDTHHPTNN